MKDLEQEKKRLLKESKQFEKGELLSIKGALGKGGDGEGESSLVDLLPISNPLVQQVVKVVLNRLSKKEERAEKRYEREEDREEKKERSLLQRAAIEFIGGYLKWKAIELSYKGLRRIIKTRNAARKSS